MTDKNIYQRLHAIMADISYVQKENKKVNNQYTFVSHDAVTAKIRPALITHGVIAIPDFFDISQDGNKTHCSVGFTFVNIDKPDDKVVIDCAGFGQGIDPQDKGAGKAMSYAVKYALLKVFGLETGDDPERESIAHVPEAKPKPEPTPEERRKAAEKFVNSYLIKLDKLTALEDFDIQDQLRSLQGQNEVLLGKIEDNYPNLHKTITDATSKKRGILPSPSGLE